MRKLVRVLALLFCLCLVLCFVGCKSGETEKSESDDAQIATEQKVNENPFAGGLVNGGNFEGH